MPPNPIVTTYLWVIYPKKLSWLHQAWPGQTFWKSTVPQSLPDPVPQTAPQMALSSLRDIFPALRDEAVTPHLNSCDELWEEGC